MKKILIINGPNLNVIGDREKDVYGEGSYDALKKSLQTLAKELSVSVEVFQSNSEGEIVTRIQEAKGEFDGIVINAGALTHYSYATYDALKYTELPVVEVHISNIFQREEFRKTSVLSSACVGIISGLGRKGYEYAVRFLAESGK
ncbi:MAG: type II 3-dehydroquinate dehydratase [Clostridiales bacterium]|jgi:3-dehydroquinate dehydratase-2|nr:type II 3-dehydroquinate dehydratase [Clostridiales bacterium]